MDRIFKTNALILGTITVLVSAAYAGKEITVPANQPYVDTGIELHEGQAMKIVGSGEIEISRSSFWGRDSYDYRVSPLGTYRCETSVEAEHFPLPAINNGPAPCYCLIGKIGERGKPFFVGKEYCATAPASGKLFLGINDAIFKDNTGSFRAEVMIGGEVEERHRPQRDDIVFNSKDFSDGKPVPDANVVLIFVDGMRYDVLREMAEAGHLPNIRSLFFDGGTDYINAFTGFPSSTLASNSAMYAGVFINRSGIKGNNYFDRKKQKGDSYLKAFGPPVAAEEHRPSNLHRLGVEIKKVCVSPFKGAAARHAEKHKDDIRLLPDYLYEQGMNYCTAAQPILSHSPPDRYEVDAATVIPPFMVHRGGRYMDEFQTRYAMDKVIEPDARVMNFWFPGIDEACHNTSRAQFGEARKEVALLDKWVGGIVEELKRKKMWDRTYIILFADHGMMGGEIAVLQEVDPARDFFYRDIADSDGDGVLDPGSGMGCNVRWYIDSYQKKGRSKKGFVYFDYGDGEGRIYLPFADVDSGKWLERNTLYQLTHYRIAPHVKEVNLIDRLLAWDMTGHNLYPEKISNRPIGQILIKLDDRRIGIFGQEGAEAIIERKEAGGQRWKYRYVPVKDLACSEKGEVTYEEASDADPFGYIKAGLPLSWMKEFHGDREWLGKTMHMEYPDSVVAVANQYFWDGHLKDREARFSPDMTLCANRGWSLEKPGELSGGHGYLLYESMRIPFLVTGPNVRKGIIMEDPVRTVDIVPTTLSLVGVSYDAEQLDGTPVHGFLMEEGEKEMKPGRSAKALFAELPYSIEDLDRGDLVAEHERRLAEKKSHIHMADDRFKWNEYDNPADLHNIAGDIFAITNREVLADLDNIIDLAVPGDRKQPVNKGLDMLVKGYDRLPDAYPKERFRELMYALQIREVTLGEVPSIIFPSLSGVAGRGVVHRGTLLLQFLEHLFSDMDYALLYPVRDKNIKVISNLNYGLEGTKVALEKISWGLAHYIGSAAYEGLLKVEIAGEHTVRAIKGQDEPISDVEARAQRH